MVKQAGVPPIACPLDEHGCSLSLSYAMTWAFKKFKEVAVDAATTKNNARIRFALVVAMVVIVLTHLPSLVERFPGFGLIILRRWIDTVKNALLFFFSKLFWMEVIHQVQYNLSFRKTFSLIFFFNNGYYYGGAHGN